MLYKQVQVILHKAKEQFCELFENELTKYNVLASPLNTKLQAVGLYLAWENYQDVQIVIGFPDRFSNWLTEGIKDVKSFKI